MNFGCIQAFKLLFILLANPLIGNGKVEESYKGPVALVVLKRVPCLWNELKYRSISSTCRSISNAHFSCCWLLRLVCSKILPVMAHWKTRQKNNQMERAKKWSIHCMDSLSDCYDAFCCLLKAALSNSPQKWMLYTYIFWWGLKVQCTIVGAQK